MTEIGEMNKGQLMYECAKRKIKGFQGKDSETMRKLVKEHDAALSKTSDEVIKKMTETEQTETEQVEPVADEEVIEENFGEVTSEDAMEILTETKIEKIKEKEDDKMASKTEKKVKKEKKASSGTLGRKPSDKAALMEDHGSPCKKDSTADVFFKLLKKGGTKEVIVKKAEEIIVQKQIKCDNAESRFAKILAAVNTGYFNYGDIKFKVSKDDKGKYLLA